MKRKRHTEEQIIAILKEHEAGVKTADLCRKHGISEASFYNWKSQVRRAGGVGGQAAEGAGERERQAEEAAGGCHAGQCGAEGSADKKMVTPAAKREGRPAGRRRSLGPCYRPRLGSPGHGWP